MLSAALSVNPYDWCNETEEKHHKGQRDCTPMLGMPAPALCSG